jgi:cobalamin biosynthesis Mg chelatase CobN
MSKSAELYHDTTRSAYICGPPNMSKSAELYHDMTETVQITMNRFQELSLVESRNERLMREIKDLKTKLKLYERLEATKERK